MKRIFGGLVVVFLAGCSALPIMSQVEPKIVGEARNGAGTVVTLLDTPCKSKKVLDALAKLLAPAPEEIKALLTPEAFKSTRALYEGTAYECCWAEPREGLVFLMWEDGGYYATPKGHFKPPV